MTGWSSSDRAGGRFVYRCNGDTPEKKARCTLASFPGPSSVHMCVAFFRCLFEGIK